MDESNDAKLVARSLGGEGSALVELIRRTARRWRR